MLNLISLDHYLSHNYDTIFDLTHLQYVSGILFICIVKCQVDASDSLNYYHVYYVVGDVPTLQYKTYPGSNGETLGVAVTQKTAGVPNGEYFTLSMAGVTSPLMEYDLSGADVSLNAKTGFSFPLGVACNLD